MATKTILEFCLSPALGGLELCVKDSFEYFKAKTRCYICVAPQKSLDNAIDDKNKINIKRNKLLPIFPALKLAKFIDEKDIDIVHFHWTRDIATVVLAKVLSKKKPKIVQSRHMRMTRFKDDFYHKWLYKNIDIIHAVTIEVEKQLKKFIPQDIRPNIKMIYLGVEEPNIDAKKVKSLKEHYKLKDEFVVGIIGRIEDAKGQHLVVEAIAKLKELNIKAFIVGDAMDSKYLQNLKNTVKELDVEDKIIFSGFTKDVDEYMQLCDCIVLATLEETFGLVVIEAMANKRCIIAVNKGGPLEIIEDGIDGLLFERDSASLSKKIKNLYDNKTSKNNIAINGYNKINKVFNKKIQLNKLIQTIQGLS
jgi:glycosyltransferase involved in cell wall biosynthesis